MFANQCAPCRAGVREVEEQRRLRGLRREHPRHSAARETLALRLHRVCPQLQHTVAGVAGAGVQPVRRAAEEGSAGVAGEQQRFIRADVPLLEPESP